MSAALGVHIEYMRGRGGLARDSGPGDTLRLLRGIACWASANGITSVDILTTSPGRCADLVVPDVVVRWLPINKNQLQDRRLETLVQQAVANGLQLSNYSHLVHAYVSPFNQASTVCGLPRVQVDTPTILSGTLAPLVATGARGIQHTLAVALRCLKNHRELGTPKGFPQAVRRWVRTHVATGGGGAWNILWYGVANRRDLDIPLYTKNGETLYAYGNDSYLTQLARLRDADLAVGVNSGGLDMAAAAGVPVLRLGTFCPSAWAGATAYNDYLAYRTNVTIDCTNPMAHVYALRPWLKAMMASSRTPRVIQPRHIVVRPGDTVRL